MFIASQTTSISLSTLKFLSDQSYRNAWQMVSGTSKCIVLCSHASIVDGFYCLTVKTLLDFKVCFFRIHQIISLQPLKRERLVQMFLHQQQIGWKFWKGYAHALWVPRKTMNMERRFLPMKWRSCWKNPCQSCYQIQRIFSHLISRCHVTTFRALKIICYTSGNGRLLYSVHQSCGNCFFLPSFLFTSLPFSEHI